jgi:hypothetical protein
MADMRPAIPDVLLERYLAGDLPASEQSRIDAACETSPELAARLAQLTVERDAFLSADPPAAFAHRLVTRLALEPKPRKLWSFWLLAPSGAAAAVALLLAVTYTRLVGDEQPSSTELWRDEAVAKAPAALPTPVLAPVPAQERKAAAAPPPERRAKAARLRQEGLDERVGQGMGGLGLLGNSRGSGSGAGNGRALVQPTPSPKPSAPTSNDRGPPAAKRELRYAEPPPGPRGDRERKAKEADHDDDRRQPAEEERSSRQAPAPAAASEAAPTMQPEAPPLATDHSAKSDVPAAGIAASPSRAAALEDHAGAVAPAAIALELHKDGRWSMLAKGGAVHGGAQLRVAITAPAHVLVIGVRDGEVWPYVVAGGAARRFTTAPATSPAFTVTVPRGTADRLLVISAAETFSLAEVTQRLRDSGGATAVPERLSRRAQVESVRVAP